MIEKMCSGFTVEAKVLAYPGAGCGLTKVKLERC